MKLPAGYDTHRMPRPTFLRSPLVKGLLASVAVFAVSRVLTMLIAQAITQLTEKSLLEVLTDWDGHWYLSIVRSGYTTDVPEIRGGEAQRNVAFFPGVPLAIEAVVRTTGGSAHVAGVLISTLAGAGAAGVLWILVGKLGHPDLGIRTVTLFSFYPSSFVLSMVYPESLFILFAAISLLAILHSRWVLAGVTASVAGLIRPTGLVLAMCCVWAAGAAIRHGSRRAVLAPLLAPIGPLAHFAYLWAHTGDPVAFFHVEERGWNQRLDFGLHNLRRFGQGVDALDIKALIVALSLLAGIIAIYLVLRWRPPAPVTIYVVGIVGLTLLSTASTSMPRYLLGAFPALIPVAKGLPDQSFPVAVAVSAALMAVLFVLSGTLPLPP
jgi:hypothetical protein